MTKFLAFIFTSITLFSFGYAQEKIAQPAPGVYYGKKIVQKNILSTSELVNKLANTNTFQGKVKGQVNEVCKMSGCYLVLQLPDAKTMTVRFKEASLKVPKELSGKQVVLEGTFSKNSKNEPLMIAEAVLVTK